MNHKIRFNVTARNSIGSTTVISGESAVVTEPLPTRRDQAAERRGLDPGDERPLDRTADRVAGRSSRRTRSASKTQPITVRVRVKDTRGFVDPRRARVRPLDPARHRGWRPAGVDRRRLGDVPARAERELPEAAEGLQRPVLREGVPLGRPRPRGHRRPTASSRCGSRRRPSERVPQLLERGPAGIGVALEVLVRLDVQVLAAHGAEPGAVRPAEDLIRKLESDRVARPGAQVRAGRRRRSPSGARPLPARPESWNSRATTSRSISANPRQRMHAPAQVHAKPEVEQGSRRPAARSRARRGRAAASTRSAAHRARRARPRRRASAS